MIERPKGFHTLSELSRLFGRGRTALVFAAKHGDLGQPRLIGRRKYYSLEIAEAHYRCKVSPMQRQAAEEKLRPITFTLDAATRLVDLSIRLRDATWIEVLAAQGITDFTSPEARR